MTRLLPRIAIALAAAATCIAAGAQTVSTGQADQERRDRNREEALSNWRSMHPASAQASESNGQVVPARKKTMRERTHQAAEKTRSVGHRVAEKSRAVGHRTAEKAREITDRTNAKFDKRTTPNRDPQGGGSSN